jgi:hypothetical protein
MPLRSVTAQLAPIATPAPPSETDPLPRSRLHVGIKGTRRESRSWLGNTSRPFSSRCGYVFRAARDCASGPAATRRISSELTNSLWQKSWQAEARPTWGLKLLIHRSGAGAFACEPSGTGPLPQAAKLSPACFPMAT